MALIMTKAALALKVKKEVEVVKFESHKPKKKVNKEIIDEPSVAQHQPGKKDLELKKIRHEIVKFGMSGFDATKKEEAKIALAVSLGAKPPKKEYMNYKELMQKRKEEKKKEQEVKELMISKTRLHTTGKPKKRTKGNDVGFLLSGYGKVQKKELTKGNGGPQNKKKKR